MQFIKKMNKRCRPDNHDQPKKNITKSMASLLTIQAHGVFIKSHIITLAMVIYICFQIPNHKLHSLVGGYKSRLLDSGFKVYFKSNVETFHLNNSFK